MKQLLKIQIMLLCAALTVIACTDDNLADDPAQGDKGATVSFNVSNAQETTLAQLQTMDMPATRAALDARRQALGLSDEDLATRRLEVQGGLDACIIETTVEGVNPVMPSADTRAKVKTAIDANFSSLGYRSATQGFAPATPNWFYKRPTKSNGMLVSPMQWHWGYRYARFYSVYPEATNANKITLSPESYSGTPYFDFEVNTNIANQTDLMTASSGEVKYETRGVAPTTNLEFYHALTAVKIAVGQNLSWNKHITKVEIQNARRKGTYHFSDRADSKGAHWDADNASRTNFTLNLGTPGVATSSLPNQVLVGKDNDNYTFYMIPQNLTGVTLHIEFSDASPINIPLSGNWRPATTKTYKISNTTSNWQYSFTVTPSTPLTAEYYQTSTTPYRVESFRTDPAYPSIKHSVAWKIVGYEEYDDATDSWVDKGMNKPDWFNGLSMVREQTIGYYGGGEQGTALVKSAELVDKPSGRDAILKLDPKGSPSEYYDLSTHDIKGTSTLRNTANCYVISHPGYYKIPLVYGNAIVGGNPNHDAYISTAAPLMAGRDLTLHTFRDHSNQDITDPWIERTNNKANNGIDGAKIVWADEVNLVHLGTNPIVRDGNETFLQFEVKPENIKNGNAVVAIMKNNVVVWSWHLWFAPDNVLDKIAVINHGGIKYYFASEDLGWTFSGWKETPYKKPRKIKVKIEQITGNGTKKRGELIVMQNAGSIAIKRGSPLYQWGRKDPLPATDVVAQGTFVKNAGQNMSIPNCIQNPEKLYTSDGDNPQYYYYNLWNTHRTTNQVMGTGNDYPVTKTVYDPCPVGFHLPANNAFTGFSATGNNSDDPEDMNVKGSKDLSGLYLNYGFYFYTDASKTATIYFPASGRRYYGTGEFMHQRIGGYYWTAVPRSPGMAMIGSYYWGGSYHYFYPLHHGYRSDAFAVRPVSDTP